MTRDEAKEILKLYRPSTDAADPSFAEALELCEVDAELREWFENHCAVYTALRSKFAQIPVPEGFKEQILAERKTHTQTSWQRVAASVIALAVIVGILSFPWISHWHQDRATRSFPTFLNVAASIALRSYSMDISTDDLVQIRAYLAERDAIADYALPANLEKNTKPTGCVATKWHGTPVTMICFRSGKPLPPDQTSDLWLFVIDRKSALGTPASAKPQIGAVNRLTVASWTIGERTYVLASDADAKFLEQFL